MAGRAGRDGRPGGVSDDPREPIPFDPTRGRAARRRVVASLREAVDDFRATMEAEQRARLEWMRRHAALLELEIPGDAAPSRALERALMAVAGERLREPRDGADPAAIATARAELRELGRIERANYERLVAEHGPVLGVNPPSTGVT